jgi:hypothetical protein
MSPEEQAIHTSIAEKLKPVFENKKSLIVNDLSAKTPVTTGNNPAKPVSHLQPPTPPIPQATTPQNQPKATTTTFAGNTSLPENEPPLIINDLTPKTCETTGNEPESLETMLQGLRKAFLQNYPLQPDNVSDPNTTPLPENETPLIIMQRPEKSLHLKCVNYEKIECY